MVMNARQAHLAVDDMVRSLFEKRKTALDDVDRALMLERLLDHADAPAVFDVLDMPLREFFAMADRVGDAARVIRDAQAMLGGPVLPPINGAYVPKLSPVPLPSHEDVRFSPSSVQLTSPPVLMTNKGPVRLTDEELAQRDALRREREAAELAADRAKLAGAS